MKLTEAIDAYLTERRGELANSTWLKHAMTLAVFAKDRQHYDVTDVDKADVLTWRSNLRVGPSSVNQYVKRVRIFFQWCEDNGHVTRSPVRGIKSLDEPAPRRVRLPPEAFGLMLSTARHPRDKALIATATELLLRGGELARLRVGDVHDDYLTVHVEKKKGVFSEDDMAISEALQRELRVWLAHYRQAAGLVEASRPLFPRLVPRLAGTETTYRIDPTQNVAAPWGVVHLALANSGIAVERGTGFHAIRRTAARLLYDHLVDANGMDRALGHVSALLHHESRKTTELYLGATGDRVLRNKLIRQGGPTPLSIATATPDKSGGTVSAISVVPKSPAVTV
jgi:integrase